MCSTQTPLGRQAHHGLACEKWRAEVLEKGCLRCVGWCPFGIQHGSCIAGGLISCSADGEEQKREGA